MNPLDWLRKAAAQTLDLAAEGYGALASWCIRTSEQLDPYTQDDYRHAAELIEQAAERFATGGEVFPRAQLRDIAMDESGRHYTAPDGSRINVGPPDNPAYPDGAFPSYWFNDSDWQPNTPRDGGEHHYVNGVCTCGWPTGIHPSETGDE